MIEQLREIGLPMGTRYAPRTVDETTTRTFVGWTSDEAKATRAQELGATIRPYVSSDARFNGWEVSCSVVER